MKYRFLLFLIGIIPFISGCSGDSPLDYQFVTVTGTVIDKANQQPVSGVKITCAGKETSTDNAGKYEFLNLIMGDQKILAEKDSYASYLEDILISIGRNRFDIELETYALFCGRVKSVNYQGISYNTVLVGNQCWFRENLNAGTKIDYKQPQINNNKLERYCLDNRIENCEKLGGLYQWNEAMNYMSEHSNRGICPDGWHVPAITEFKTLGFYVMDDGNSLKCEGEGDSLGGCGTNESGWSAVMGGTIDYDSGCSISSVPGFPRFWSTSEADSSRAYDFGLCKWNDLTFYMSHDNRCAVNIRCLKD